jgi:hypothetical protein
VAHDPAWAPGLASVFDRQRQSHVWLHALSELEAADATIAAVVANWRMDHRLSEAREKDILGSGELGKDLNGRDWWAARREHFRRTVCRAASPKDGGAPAAYLSASNGNNALDRRRLPYHEQFLHVTSLNRVLERLLRAGLDDRVRLALEDLTGRGFSPRLVGSGYDPSLFATKVDELARAVNGLGERKVRELATLLADALGPHEPPWWSAFAQEVVPEVRRMDWVELAAVLGLGHLRAGDWVFLWHFELSLVFDVEPGASLTRPTVIEANDSPYHFPSPPSVAWGIAMPLRDTLHGAVREVLHPPLRAMADTGRCDCRLVQLAQDPAPDLSTSGLAKLRARHRQRLQSEYPAGETGRWLERHRGSA